MERHGRTCNSFFGILLVGRLAIDERLELKLNFDLLQGGDVDLERSVVNLEVNGVQIE